MLRTKACGSPEVIIITAERRPEVAPSITSILVLLGGDVR